LQFSESIVQYTQSSFFSFLLLVNVPYRPN
jgi:hypothetical protein